MKTRLLIAAGVVGFGLVLVMGRLVQLTVVRRAELAQHAEIQHQKRITWTPRRGAVVDRNGIPLALSVAAESLYIRPNRLPPDRDKWMPALATALQMPVPQVNRLVHKPAPFVWLKRRVSPPVAAQVRGLGIQGVGSRETERRFYPQGTLAAPLLGFTDVDAKGLEGIERAYDRYLRGEPEEIVGERDAFGRMIFAHGVEDQAEAFQVRLTLDASIQYIAERELERAVQAHRAKAGTVVVLEPRTFAVLAMAQVPTFDPNTPTAVPSRARRNHAISDVYEPGSTLKALLAAAALDMQVVHPDEQIDCERGRYRIGRWTIRDHHPYGRLSFADVIKHSSNIGVAKVGQRLGAQAYYRYLRAFGLGQTTGIDLPAESAGLLPQPKQWRPITVATTSFGHGVAVTPLQLASAFATLANDGVLMRPYLVQEIRNGQDKLVKANHPQYVWQAVQTNTAQQVIQLLERVVEDGTGRRAQIEGFRVAGKTGTAQKLKENGGYSQDKYIASFVGIVPVEAPRLVIAVAIDEPRNGRYGGQVAAPVFQAIGTKALASLGIEASLPKGQALQYVTWSMANRHKRDIFGSFPTLVSVLEARDPSSSARSVQAAVFSVAAEVADSGPNFIGLSLREAQRLAKQNDRSVAMVGSGYVTQQTQQTDPQSGETISVLTLSPSGSPGGEL